MRTFDSSAWTGRRPNPWPQIFFRRERFSVMLGWCPLVDACGVRFCFGRAAPLRPNVLRYLHRWEYWIVGRRQLWA